MLVRTLLILIAVAASGCAHASASESTTPRPVADGGSAFIYAAAVKQILAEQQSAQFENVYILDGVVPGAADPGRLAVEPRRRFSQRLSDALAVALADLPVTFVGARTDVVSGQPPGRVPDGVLLTLGQIERRDGTASVPVSSWVNGLNGRWLTYRLRQADGGWRVVGTQGPIAIS